MVSTVQVIINGATTDLTLNAESGLFEGNVTAPAETSYNNNAEHYFPVTIKAVDAAGNQTVVNDTDVMLGSKLKLRVMETVLPVIIITSPTESELTANPTPTVNWTVTDSGSGVDPDTIGITIDDGNKIVDGITKMEITNGYICSYSISEPLGNGAHTIYIDATDYDGNAATQRTVNFTVDTVPPELSVTAPVNNYVTNNATITVSGAASDVTAGLASVTVRINGGSAQMVEVVNGVFSQEFSLANGANTIVVTATDTVGLQTQITRIATLDTDAPVISDVVLTLNPVSTGEILNVQVTVMD